MAGEFVVTIGDISNIPQIFRGPLLKGRREGRVAMVGRSNVGKSSLVNALLAGKFAQVSNQPGKTRAIHFYFWKEARKIVADLPGYGFAKTSQGERNRWSKFIQAYFDADPMLERVLILLDARHGPMESDRNAIEFFRSLSIPVAFIFTKADTLKTQSERAKRRQEVAAAFKELGIENEPSFWVSTRTDDGLKALQRYLVSECK